MWNSVSAAVHKNTLMLQSKGKNSRETISPGQRDKLMTRIIVLASVMQNLVTVAIHAPTWRTLQMQENNLQ